jgi:hypothetical protein
MLVLHDAADNYLTTHIFHKLNNLSRKNDDGRQMVKVNLGWWILFHTSSSGCNLEVSAHQKGQPRLMQYKLHHAVSFYQIPCQKLLPTKDTAMQREDGPAEAGRNWLIKDGNLAELIYAKN